jgi:hypothetical protein
MDLHRGIRALLRPDGGRDAPADFVILAIRLETATTAVAEESKSHRSIVALSSNG